MTLAIPNDPVESLSDRYLRAQLRGDRRGAVQLIVDSIAGGLSCADVHGVLADAQREIGRLWQEDRITVAQEHMATAISQVVLSHVYQHAAAPAANGKAVLVACVEGELHDFPARLVADALDLGGFEVRFLGADVPIIALLAMLDKDPPDLLVLSVTMTFNVPSLRRAVSRVRERYPRLPLAIGGGACAWNQGLSDELGATVAGGNAAELVENARALFGVKS